MTASRRTAVYVYCYAVAGYAFTFASCSIQAHRLLHHLYGLPPMRPIHPNAAFTLFESPGAGDRWHVGVNGRTTSRWPSFNVALQALEYEIARAALDHQQAHIALHGATLSTDAGTVLITGPSGAGKTTLALALAARGLPLGGDDLVLAAIDGAMLTPFPRCFHLDRAARALLQASAALLDGPGSAVGFLTPADLPAHATGPAPLRLLIALAPERAATPRIEQRTQAEGLLALAGQAGAGSLCNARLLETLAAVIRGATCFRLTAADLPATVAAVLRLLDATVRTPDVPARSEPVTRSALVGSVA